MKKITRFVSVLLSICLLSSLLSCGGTSQGGTQSTGSSESGESNSQSQSVQESTSESGITPYVDGVDYTEFKLVDDGESDYTMVIPEDSTFGEDCAYGELEELFEEATGITLDYEYDCDIDYADDAKLILIGNTCYTENSGVDVSSIPYECYVLKTVGQNVFVLGDGKGVLYGMYEFLAKTLHYEYYIDDEYRLDHNVNNLYLPDLDCNDAPDFNIRADGWGYGNLRTRTEDKDTPFMKNGVNPIHNTFEWLPPKTYQAAHPSWYSDDGSQLCLTAHGNEEELAEMRATVLKKFKDQVKFYWDGKDADTSSKIAIPFTQQDSTTWCDCSACNKVIGEAGAKSATIIEFLNPIAHDLQEWIDGRYEGHTVDIVFFAYNATEKAPVKKVGDNIVPTIDSVKMEDNLSVWLAMPRGQYPYDVTDVKNTDMYTKIANWSAMSKHLYIWTYDTNYVYFMTWYDTFGSLQSLYKYANSKDAIYYFNQGQSPGVTQTGFNMFKASLNYQLMWDVNMDVDGYTERFFDAWFGPASKDMKAYYDSFRTWSANVRNTKHLDWDMCNTLINQSYYSKDVLDTWMGNIEDAYDAIESLKNTDNDRYKTILQRINNESIAVRYHLIWLYPQYYQPDELLQMKRDFKADATAWGFTRLSELEDINKLWQGWGI